MLYKSSYFIRGKTYLPFVCNPNEYETFSIRPLLLAANREEDVFREHCLKVLQSWKNLVSHLDEQKLFSVKLLQVIQWETLLFSDIAWMILCFFDCLSCVRPNKVRLVCPWPGVWTFVVSVPSMPATVLPRSWSTCKVMAGKNKEKDLFQKKYGY